MHNIELMLKNANYLHHCVIGFCIHYPVVSSQESHEIHNALLIFLRSKLEKRAGNKIILREEFIPFKNNMPLRKKKRVLVRKYRKV